jgi:hypothetical protein
MYFFILPTQFQHDREFAVQWRVQHMAQLQSLLASL